MDAGVSGAAPPGPGGEVGVGYEGDEGDTVTIERRRGLAVGPKWLQGRERG